MMHAHSVNTAAVADAAFAAPDALTRIILVSGFSLVERLRFEKHLLESIASACSADAAHSVRSLIAAAGPTFPKNDRDTLSIKNWIQRAPPSCPCCPDLELLENIRQLATTNPAWLIIEIPATHLMLMADTLRCDLPSHRLQTVLIKRYTHRAGINHEGVWDLPGLIDFIVTDDTSSQEAIKQLLAAKA